MTHHDSMGFRVFSRETPWKNISSVAQLSFTNHTVNAATGFWGRFGLKSMGFLELYPVYTILLILKLFLFVKSMGWWIKPGDRARSPSSWQNTIPLHSFDARYLPHREGSCVAVVLSCILMAIKIKLGIWLLNCNIWCSECDIYGILKPVA
jgi:hypothetical protein